MVGSLNILVVYSRNLDAGAWARDYLAGSVPDRTPYGYHHAEAHGCKLTYSKPTSASGFKGAVGRILRWVLKFDIAHVWSNREAIFDPKYDVIWTHTEREHLGIALLRWVTGKPSAPIIAQSVWLFDRWKTFGPLRRAFIRRLLTHLDVLTFLSPMNADYARSLKVGDGIAVVPFGISLDSFPMLPPRRELREAGRVRVLAIGNDEHRDWETLSSGLGDIENVEVRILSRNFPRKLLKGNMTLEVAGQEGVRAAYDWADCVVVPLHQNMHASGITVVLEATALGLPVIATRTGGVVEYLDDRAIDYVEVGDHNGIRSAVLSLIRNHGSDRVQRAQDRFRSDDYTTNGYARRHVELSRALLAAAER